MNRGKIPVFVEINRSQSLAILRAINIALADTVRWPHGPDRFALEAAKKRLVAARNAAPIGENDGR